MGIIKAFNSSFKSVKDEQWKDVFMCESLGTEILVARGLKHASERSTNTNSNDGKITHGSLVIVADGQNALVVKSGKIISAFTEPGEYRYEEPDYKGFVHGFAKDLAERISFGGLDVNPDMSRVYFVNMMESYDNRFQTSRPIPVKINKQSIGLDLDTGLMVEGTFSFRITDSVLFYSTISGNVSGFQRRQPVAEHIRTLVLKTLIQGTEILSRIQMEPSELPLYSAPLSEYILKNVNDAWCSEHGLLVTGISISSLSITDMDIITRLGRDATFRM